MIALDRRQFIGGAAGTALALKLGLAHGQTETLVEAWDCSFEPTGSVVPIFTALAASPYTDRTVFGEYRSWNRYLFEGRYYAGTPVPAALWADNNHSQVERLYLGAIFPAAHSLKQEIYPIPKSLAIPSPQRTLDDGEVVHGLDFYGGRVEFELLANNLHLDKVVQIAVLLQWKDPEANNGRGGHVNYLVRRKVSIDEVMGFTPSHARGVSGEQRTTGWVPVSIDFPADDPNTIDREHEDGLIPIDGRPDKVTANVYGRSVNVRKAYRRELANMMLVFHCGQQVPPRQPLQKSDGGYGELYCRKARLLVDPVLNPAL